MGAKVSQKPNKSVAAKVKAAAAKAGIGSSNSVANLKLVVADLVDAIEALQAAVEELKAKAGS